jgi:multisubunit Na+/H+ antiporter MnhB subunit
VNVSLAIDAVLALGLVTLAVLVTSGRALFRDIVLFVVFGLIVALVWARLGSADLALAEAAIGAGVTGALMLIAHRRLGGTTTFEAADRPAPPRFALPVAILVGSAVAVIGLSALGIERVVEGAGAAAQARTGETGLRNPITGVLLAFRNLDTLLEMVVLLAALLGAWAIAGPEEPDPVHRATRDTPLVAALLSAVVPLSVLIATHLLLAGTDQPGGAFQAGAVLAGCGVLLVLTGTLRPAAAAGFVTRLLVVAGAAAFVLVGVGAMAFGSPPMTMPGGWAVYLVETAMMLSIAVTLTLLFARSRGLRGEER